MKSVSKVLKSASFQIDCTLAGESDDSGVPVQAIQTATHECPLAQLCKQ
jgi:hypothetical protein